ncbi:MAG TPA: hypothetical protein VFN42_05575 [Acetobacteraceae bacterium]|nr:hypothetical protein [Acetobacteraceae bacterium]
MGVETSRSGPDMVRRLALERPVFPTYYSPMDDTPHRQPPADWEPPMPSEAELRASLARSDADIAAGRTVPASAVHAELQAALDRIEARRPRERSAAARR